MVGAFAMPRGCGAVLLALVASSVAHPASAGGLSMLQDAVQDVLELDDVCVPRGGGCRSTCAFSAIQVRGSRDQDVALMMDDEFFAFGAEEDHCALSSLGALNRVGQDEARQANSTTKKVLARRLTASADEL
eukprot:gb/GFBE01045924.1/.p1 GENE.gb/GFBE01045924.1/~~gb/GFBE01045924.1/.p1  ORF type:complete len:132 (+),score=29.35 gb/GFBE01045924.1/:1-396(+)